MSRCSICASTCTGNSVYFHLHIRLKCNQFSVLHFSRSVDFMCIHVRQSPMLMTLSFVHHTEIDGFIVTSDFCSEFRTVFLLALNRVCKFAVCNSVFCYHISSSPPTRSDRIRIRCDAIDLCASSRCHSLRDTLNALSLNGFSVWPFIISTVSICQKVQWSSYIPWFHSKCIQIIYLCSFWWRFFFVQ